MPILVIESFEEPRVLEMITRLAVKRASALYAWSITEGLNRLGFGNRLNADDNSQDATEVLRFIKEADEPAIYVLCDFHPHINEDPVNVRLLREIAMRHQKLGYTIIFLSHAINLPNEVKRCCARFELSMPTEEQLMNLVREEASSWSKDKGNRPVKSNTETFNKLVNNLKGVSLQDARQLVRGVIYDGGAIEKSDLPELNKAKFALMDMEGVLSFEYDTAKFNEVGGLHKLKKWLEDRKDEFLDDKDDKLHPPKGLMLLGAQGSGKSLAANTVAGMLAVPLLRLDFGSLYNKFYGETERNLREALKLADMMSPCVPWLDEIEKGISTSQNDVGISQRVLGTLLTWMAERKSQAFVVATSNDITQLPPELVRKGRLDEIFFVDLPSSEVRIEIFDIHLTKRKLDAKNFDLPFFAGITEGFSGAEIEQAIVSALYTVSAVDESPSPHQLETAIRSTNPLSVVMHEKIDNLRLWAKERCVFAD